MWLRRQDELNEARPTERFSTAIRLLSGRAAMERKISRQLEETQPLAPPTSPSATSPKSSASATSDAAEGADALPRAPHPAPAEVQPSFAASMGSAASSVASVESRRRAALLARRRRMVVVLFAAFTLGMIAAAVGGVALLWLPAVPAVLFSLYIAQMRRQERRRYEVKLDRRRATEAAQRVRQQAAARRAESAAPAEPTTSGSGALASPAAAHTAPAAQAAPAAPEPWADDDRPEHASPAGHQPPVDDAWDPVPVPLPTYVTAPVAPRATLGLDLSAPDTYSSGRKRPVAPPASATSPRRPTAPPSTPLFDQYADDTPRAANE